MTCTWTDRDFYTEYVNTQLRGDGGILGNMYHPSRNGAKVHGGDVIVSIVDIENMSTAQPACGSFAGEHGNCNTSATLTMVERMVDKCFTPCEWEDMNADAGNMQRFVAAQSSVLAGYFVDLIAASMIAGGTSISVGAAPDKDDLVVGINTALAQIWCRNLPGKITILFEADNFGTFMQGVGGTFQPVSRGLVGPDVPTDQAFRGWYNGAEVWLTCSNLQTADATPVDVCAIVFHEMGYAWASAGEGLGATLGLVPPEANVSGPLVYEYIGGCFGYGLLDDEMVYYLLES